MREKAYNIREEGEKGGGTEGSEKMYTLWKGETGKGSTDGKGGRPTIKRGTEVRKEETNKEDKGSRG